MNFNEIMSYLDKRVSIEKIPIDWEPKAYISDEFNRWASGVEFSGWANDKETEKEAAVIYKMLQVKGGNSLLDVCCGYGRHALVFTEKYGLKVTGIDISLGLIATAKRRAEENGLDIQYEVRRATALPWKEEFDSAIIAFNTLSLFSETDASIVLKGINRSIKQGSRLFIDLDNKPYNCRYGTSAHHWYRWPTGLTLQDIFFYEDISVEVCRDTKFSKDSDKIIESIIFKRIYTPEEISNLLEECSYRVGQIYGDWDLSSISESSPKMLLAAEKI